MKKRIMKCVSILLLSVGLLQAAEAAELKWIEPFDVAKQEAKKSGKPMLVFIGNVESCKDCRAFTNELCANREFIDYATANLVCTRVLYGKKTRKRRATRSRRSWRRRRASSKCITASVLIRMATAWSRGRH